MYAQSYAPVLSQIGIRGGRKSRRELRPEVARAMVRLREARRAYQKYHVRCFWSYDPDYRVEAVDIEWVIEGLLKHGGRDAFYLAARLQKQAR